MSICTRQIQKPVVEKYTICDKCGKEITGHYSQFGIGTLSRKSKYTRSVSRMLQKVYSLVRH